MTHRIFYGTDFKLTDSDKKMFSREGYECKDLLQGRAGLPVVVSQKQDMDFRVWCSLLMKMQWIFAEKIYKIRWKGGVVDADDKIPSSD